MKNARFVAAVCAAALAALSTPTIADRDHDGPLPRNATFTTQAITPLAIEGLTADDAGNLYTTGRATPHRPLSRLAASPDDPHRAATFRTPRRAVQSVGHRI